MVKNRPSMTTGRNLLFRICVIGSLAGLLFGMDVGIIGGALPFLAKQFSLSDQSSEIVVSAVLFGAILGTVSCNFLGKPFGRRRLIRLAAAIFVIGSLMSALAPTPMLLILARIILGIGVGMAAFNAPLYLSEVSPVEYRGAMIAMYQAMINLGIVAAMSIDVGFTYLENWRFMLFSLTVPAFFLIIAIQFVPPSPRWLVMANRLDEAKSVLRQIREKGDGTVDDELNSIIQVERQSEEGLSLFRSNRRFRSVVYLGVALQAAQQFTGINIVFYYAPRIFELVGFSSSISQIWGGLGLASLALICTLIVIPLVDRIGRKPLLYGGGLGMGTAFLVLAVIFHGGIKTDVEQAVAVAMLCSFVVAFSFSSAPVTWILCSEINPLKGRNFGMMMSTSANWTANLLVSVTFLSLLNVLGEVSTFALYGVINILLLGFYFFFVPETKGVPLEAIEKNLMKGLPLRQIGR